MDALATLYDVTTHTARAPALGLTFAPWAVEFMADGALRKLLRGPNQVGKTTAMAADAVHEIEGTNPYRERLHSGPINVMFMSESFEQMFAPGSVVEKVWDLLPREHLDPSVGFVPGKGLTGTKYPTVRMVDGPNAGGSLFFRTYDQDPLKSVTIHSVYCDEPAPERVYAEIGPRLWKHRGRLTIGFTPVPNMPPQDWLRRLVEPTDGGDPVFSEHHVTLTEEACWPDGYARPFYTAADIARFRAETPEAQRAMRFDAAWEPLVTDRWLSAFDRDEHVKPLNWHRDPGANEIVVVGTDHGIQPGKQASMLVAVENPGTERPTVAFVDEYCPDGYSTTDQNAEGVIAMLRRNGLAYGDVDVWIGDVPALGRKAVRRKANADMRRELARVAGIEFARTKWIETPNKYRSSHITGLEVMNALFARGAAIVDTRCEKFATACERFRGRKDDPHKDILDAGRYGMEAAVDGRSIVRMVARY